MENATANGSPRILPHYSREPLTIGRSLDYATLSDVELLGKLIGVRQSRQLYRGSLQPLFSPGSGDSSPPARCIAARELVRRWLNEELRTGPALTSPGAV